MNWQEYQEAVGELYRQLEGMGNFHKNMTLPDKLTGQPRQIDTLIEIHEKSHTLRIMIDAKFRKEKLDVKDVEEVYALGNAVGVNKCVIVTSAGLTAPAEKKAQHIGMDIRIWSIEEALDVMVPDKWIMCPICNNDCIVMSITGGALLEGLWTLFCAGRCRQCQSGLIWCLACGVKQLIQIDNTEICACNHFWKNEQQDLSVNFHGESAWTSLDEIV